MPGKEGNINVIGATAREVAAAALYSLLLQAFSWFYEENPKVHLGQLGDDQSFHPNLFLHKYATV
ncbi:unnamed protein product [Sphenostylis stenocarpa]|uniref:Uncharacterized protein n=1 Tax=Sphenostylis stenocarpa TaxID=92480 RepID=A0AA86SUW1_9FABA|nr:unnamed protein product [Sphenostylis stenocarpa]